MMNGKQLAIIRKDVRSITSVKRVFSSILIVPAVLTIVVPSIFILLTVLSPDLDSDFREMLNMLPVVDAEYDEQQLVLELILNKVMPIFFLMIPFMASSVMAASSFVGEKEKHTLETLLYSPLSLTKLFHAKILAAFFVGMLVSFISFAAMIIVVEAETLLLTGMAILPDLSWLVVMLLIAPELSLAAIAIIVRSSAKAQTIEEAQQKAVFLIFPILALIIGQFGGVMLIDSGLLLIFGIILAVIDAVLMKGVAGKFTYEKLLK